MTERYHGNPMPHILDVRCPGCGANATFYFATGETIKRREDIRYFEKSSAFEVEKFQRDSGGFGHVAIHYHGLHGDLSAVDGLPEGYEIKCWKYPKHFSRLNTDHGAIRCTTCGYQRKHTLVWPKDAWFQIEHKGQILWAFTREHAAELMDYLQSDERKRSDYRYQTFLLKLPSHFKGAKDRDAICKKLSKLLSA